MNRYIHKNITQYTLVLTLSAILLFAATVFVSQVSFAATVDQQADSYCKGHFKNNSAAVNSCKARFKVGYNKPAECTGNNRQYSDKAGKSPTNNAQCNAGVRAAQKDRSNKNNSSKSNSSKSSSSNASASSLSLHCKSEYEAVKKAAKQSKAKEAAAETKLVKSVKDKTGKPWCSKNLPNVYLTKTSKNAAIEKCGNWFISKFKNPPNNASPSGKVDKQAQILGAELRNKYRNESNKSSTSGSGSGSSNSGSDGGSSNGSSEGSGSDGGSSNGSSEGSGSDGGPKGPPPIADKDDPALDCLGDDADDEKCDLVAKYINPVIVFLSAFVGIAVVIGIVSGGIRYASAGDDAQKTAAGRTQIRNAIIALVAYIFLYALIKWLIPQMN